MTASFFLEGFAFTAFAGASTAATGAADSTGAAASVTGASPATSAALGFLDSGILDWCEVSLLASRLRGFLRTLHTDGLPRTLAGACIG